MFRRPNELIRRWSAFAWPAVIDLNSGRSYLHQGRVAVGGVYAGWLRSQTRLALGIDEAPDGQLQKGSSAASVPAGFSTAGECAASGITT